MAKVTPKTMVITLTVLLSDGDDVLSVRLEALAPIKQNIIVPGKIPIKATVYDQRGMAVTPLM
jgi:hypothetical protein